MQVVSGPGRARARPLRSAAADAAGREMRPFLDWFNARASATRSGAEGGARASVVRHHPSVRRRQRPHRARDRRHGAGALGAAARSASTACRRRSARSGGPTTTSWKRRRRATSTSRAGSRGSWRCLGRAIDGAETTLAAVLAQGALLGSACAGAAQRAAARSCSTGCSTASRASSRSSKWAALAKCSQDTALRDIDDLVRRGVLARDAGGGRSTSYSLAEIPRG